MSSGFCQVAGPVSEPQNPPVCRSSSQFGGKAPSGPNITVAELKFEGNFRLSHVEQDQIAAEIQKQPYGSALDEVVNEIQERARLAWQEYGYFNVEVSENSTKVLSSNPINQRVALVLHVEEGRQ